MTREECENQVLEKLREIKDIVEQYDESKELYLSMTLQDNCMAVNNSYWETETPLEATRYNDGRVIHCDN